jgi:hypothetical protein
MSRGYVGLTGAKVDNCHRPATDWLSECLTEPCIDTRRSVGLHIRNESCIDRQRSADACVASPFADDLDVYTPFADARCGCDERRLATTIDDKSVGCSRIASWVTAVATYAVPL